MSSTSRCGPLLALFALAAGIPPAGAQLARPNYRRDRPTSYLVPLAPRTVWHPAQELVEQEFMYMRANGPNPDRFLYGRYNPRYQLVTPPQTGFTGIPGQYYGSSYGYGYGSVFYNPYLVNPFGYQQGVVQREVIIIRDGTRANEGAPVAPPQRPRPQQPAIPGTGPGDDFYLRRTAPTPAPAEAVQDALADIRKAWLNGDFERIRARFAEPGTVGIYPKGQFQVTMESSMFLAVIRDAMSRLDTLSFEFDRPRTLPDGRVFVSGRHVLMDEHQSRRESHISYVLGLREGRWVVEEAGSSSTGPIARHEGQPAG